MHEFSRPSPVFRLPWRRHSEIEEEVAFHLDMRARELEARGLDADAARAEARRQFGDMDDAVAYCRRMDDWRSRDMRHLERIQGARQDVRYALRALRRSPGFALLATLTLALGIGANVAVFTMLDHALLRAIDVPRPERLVVLVQRDAATGAEAEQITYGDFTDIRERTDLFEHVALLFNASATLVDESGPDRIRGRQASPALFPMLGISPMLGRAFRAEDAIEDGGRVVLLSHGFWSTRFGSDSAVVGRTVRLDGEPHRVIGVLPPDIEVPFPSTGTQVWLPLFDDPDRVVNRNFWGFWSLARLREGVSLAQARSALEALGVRLEDRYPASNAGRRFSAHDLRDVLVGERRPALLALAGAAAFVLLLACVNLTNLLLARGAARGRELAVRAALGAGRWRLIRQLAFEAMLVSLSGAAIGVVLAFGALETVTGMGIGVGARVDARVLTVATILSLVTGLACGIWPGLRVTRGATADVLRSGPRASAGRSERRLADGLVAAQVALAFVLLVGAGLMLATVATALRGNAGFDRSGTLAFRVLPPATRYPDRESVLGFYQRVRESAATIPGVRRVTTTSTLPLGNRAGSSISRRDRPNPRGVALPEVVYGAVPPGYFSTLGIPVVRGREFEPRDLEDDEHVTIISDETVRSLFAGEDPIGRQVRLGPAEGEDWHRIVGVVGSVRHEGLTAEPVAAAYELYGEHWVRPMWIVARASGDPSALVAPLRARLRELDPEVPMFDVATMRDRATESLLDRRLVLRLLMAFGVTALILSGIGIYGVTAESVAQRRRELGIRLALGATGRRLRGSVLGRAAALASVGIAVGIAAALASTRALAALVFGVSVREPAVFIIGVLVLTGLAMLAAWLPARRAARTDPVLVMRAE